MFVAKAYYDNEVIGLIAIDELINGKAAGGIRVIDKANEDILRALARNQTLKNAFLGLALGGAKGAVIIHEDDSKDVRKTKMRLFGKRFSNLLTRSFIPGMDTGLSLEDMAQIMDGAGYRHNVRKWSNKSSLNTALSAHESAKAALNYNKTELKGKRIIIEGLGEVGTKLLKRVVKDGALIVGVSTRFGALYNCNGLDIHSILRLKRRLGGYFVIHYKNKIAPEDLLIKEADILFTCAVPYTITEGVALKIKSKLIIPVSNLPATKNALAVLYQRGISLIPNYISNSGGVYGSYYQPKISKIRNYIETSIYYLLEQSNLQYRSMHEIAQELCEKRINKIKKNADKNLILSLNHISHRFANKFMKKKILNPGLK